MSEYDIVLELCAPPSVDNGLLESHMFDVLAVVEQHAEDIALGPVVSVDFDKGLIDLGFNVEAQSLEHAQNRVREVLGIIEVNTEVNFTPTATSASIAGRHADQLSASLS